MYPVRSVTHLSAGQGPAPQAWEGEGHYAMDSKCEAQIKNPPSAPEHSVVIRLQRNRNFGRACAIANLEA